MRMISSLPLVQLLLNAHDFFSSFGLDKAVHETSCKQIMRHPKGKTQATSESKTKESVQLDSQIALKYSHKIQNLKRLKKILQQKN